MPRRREDPEVLQLAEATVLLAHEPVRARAIDELIALARDRSYLRRVHDVFVHRLHRSSLDYEASRGLKLAIAALQRTPWTAPQAVAAWFRSPRDHGMRRNASAGTIEGGPRAKSQGDEMKTDNDLRRNVERELEWEPSVDHRRIGVAVVDGIVTLTGDVRSYAERWNAERAVERVAGVQGIVNDLEVLTASELSDTDIAKAAVDALKSNVLVPSDRITVKVSKGWLTLTGDVNWDYQRRAAERSVRDLPGVRGIANLITIRPRVQPENIREKIVDSFEREALLDAQSVTVEVSGGEVTLRGTVRSWLERREAERAAWAAPGVTAVHNYITVKEPVAA